jgi:hypothetical protein
MLNMAMTFTTMTKRKRSEHYVNNKEFLSALIDYQAAVERSYIEEFGEVLTKDKKGQKWSTKPVIPKYIGACFLKIATHLSYKTNFINYIFIDDMVSDGIENCVQYIHNFNPDKSKNPFAYFTQIIHYAFLRRIQKEKRQLDIKSKILEKTGFDEVFWNDNNTIDSSNYSDYNSIKESVHMKTRY